MDDVDFLLKKPYWYQRDIEKIFSHLSQTERAQLIELSESCANEGTLKTRPIKEGYWDCYSYYPVDFISWLIEVGVPKSWIPQELLDWHAEKIKTPMPQTSIEQSEEKPFSETERNTMLKLIIGMAMDAYKYDPNAKRNTATGEKKDGIRAKLELRGIDISNDTIHNYLTEAKKLL